MATRMQQRRGTAAELLAENAIPAEGELVFDEDTLLFKLGNGVDTWENLPYPLYNRTQSDARFAALVHTHAYAAPDHTHTPEAHTHVHDHTDKLLKAGDTMSGILNMNGFRIDRPILYKARELQGGSSNAGTFNFDGASSGTETNVRIFGTNSKTFTATNIPGAGSTTAPAVTFVVYCLDAFAITFSGAYWRFTNGIPSWVGSCLMTITLTHDIAVVSFGELTTS